MTRWVVLKGKLWFEESACFFIPVLFDQSGLHRTEVPIEKFWNPEYQTREIYQGPKITTHKNLH